jgi:hypothetical protein
MAQPGYPLPDGELGGDEIVCQLVYLPDRPEYWRAFYGALSYMSTWRAWERDDGKRGKDAAANWRQALELTTECWRMTCLQDLQDDVASILALIQTNVGCCAENVTYGDQTTYITTIVVDAGDDPDYYGETVVSDWDEWKEYLCYSAHAWVDHLVSQANSLELALSLGGLTMAMLSYVFGAVNFLLMRGDINSSTLLSRLSLMTAGYAANMFSDASDAIESARDDIVCAVLQGSSMSNAVEDALSSGIVWDVFFQFVDYESAKAIMYEGGDGEDFLEAEKKDDCEDCGQIGEFLSYTDFETGTLEGWSDRGAAVVNGIGVGGSWGVSLALLAGDDLHISVAGLADMVGETTGAGDKILIHRVSMWYRQTGVRCLKGYIAWDSDVGSDAQLYDYSDTFVLAEKIFSPAIECTHNLLEILILRGINGDGDGAVLDNITVDFDIEFA